LDVGMDVVGDLAFAQKISSLYDLSEFRQS
jgi:hypothetical protein